LCKALCCAWMLLFVHDLMQSSYRCHCMCVRQLLFQEGQHVIGCVLFIHSRFILAFCPVDTSCLVGGQYNCRGIGLSAGPGAVWPPSGGWTQAGAAACSQRRCEACQPSRRGRQHSKARGAAVKSAIVTGSAPATALNVNVNSCHVQQLRSLHACRFWYLYCSS
jgi:hypothetical protein